MEISNWNDVVNFVVGISGGIFKLKSLFRRKSEDRLQVESNYRLKVEKIIFEGPVTITIIHANSAETNPLKSNQAQVDKDKERK